MKLQRWLAIGLAAVLSVSACLPVSVTGTYASETGSTQETAAEEAAGAAVPGSEAAEAEDAMTAQEAGDAAQEAAEEAGGDAAAADAVPDEAGDPAEDAEPAGTDGEQEAASWDESIEDAAEADSGAAEADPIRDPETSGPAGADDGQERETREAVPSGDPSAESGKDAEADSFEAASPAEDRDGSLQEIPAETDAPVKEEVSTDRMASAEEHENDFALAADISAGVPVDVNVTEDSPYAFFRFTPDEDGIYAFYGDSASDTYAELFLFNPETGDYEWVDSDDDSGDNSNFRVTHICSAGETYCLRAREYSCESCSFTVTVERDLEAEASDPFFSAEEIGAPGSAQGQITEEEHVNYYRFTPEKDGYYLIYTESGCDTSGELYDADRMSICREYDGAEDNNFLISRFLEGGKTWYIGVGMDSSDVPGSYTLHIDRDDESFHLMPVGDTYIQAEPGEAVELRVRAQSTSEVSYNWYVDGDLVQEGSSDTYSFTPEKRCEVLCEASNEDGGSDSCGFNVEIRAAWNLTSDVSGDSVVGPEETRELKLQAEIEEGYEDAYTLEFYWKGGDGTELENDSPDPSVYTVRNVNGSVGIYGCARDQYGTEQAVCFVFTNPGVLGVWAGSEFEEFPGETSYTCKVSEGDTAWLRAWRNDVPDETPVSFTWTDEEGTELEEYRDSETCGIYDVQENRTIYCHAEDDSGNSADLTFNIRIGSSLTVYPVGNEDTEETYLNVDILGQDQVTLSVYARNSQDYPLTYQWRKFTRPDGDYDHEWGDSDNIDGATEADLVVTDPDIHDIYCCNVRDEDGNEASAAFYLQADTYLEAYIGTSEDDPDDPSYSTRITLDADSFDSITLIARGESADPDRITYQWYKAVGDGEEEELTGETGSSLEVTGPENGSTYLCRVGDGYGNTSEVRCDFRHENHLEVRPAEDADSNWLDIDPRSAGTFTLTPYVKADDMSGLTYTWTESIAGGEETAVGSGSTLQLDRSPDNGTVYSLRVTDPYGNEGYAHYVFQVDTKLRVYPETAQEGRDSVTVVIGGRDSVTLTAVVECEEGTSLHYQWRDDNGWFEGEKGEMTGGGQLSYVVPSPEDGAYYYCTVADDYGNERNATFILRDSAPALTAYPEGAEEGEDTANIRYDDPDQPDVNNLIVNYTGETPVEEVLFTWKDGEGNILKSEYGTYVYNEGGYQDGATFSCTLEDPYGQSLTLYFALSENVKLGVYPEYDDIGSAWRYQYDRTYSGSETLIIEAGQEPLLKTIVDLRPEGDYTCTWYASEELYPDDDEWGEPLAGETGETLQAKASYRACKCVVEAEKDGTSAEAIFRLEVMNQLTVYPEGNRRGDESADLYIKPGEKAALTPVVEASDTTGLVYSWSQLEDLGDEDRWNPLGTDTKTLTTGALESNASYMCEVTDRYGNEGCAYFYIYTNKLSVYPAGRKSSDEYMDLKAVPGKDVLLQAKVETEDPDRTKVTWQVYDDEKEEYVKVGDDPDAAASGTAEYTVKSIPENCTYRCLAKDACGNTRAAYFSIVVNHFDAFIDGAADRHYDSVSVATGRELTMTASVEGDDLSKVTYTWEKDDEEITEGVSASGNALTVTPENGYSWYLCHVSDGYGNTVTLEFCVNTGDLIAEADGEDWFRIPAHSSVTMKVKAETSAQDRVLSYSWLDADENPIQGETTDTFTVQPDRSADYYCLVTDGDGNEAKVEFEVVIDNHLDAWVKGDPEKGSETTIYVPTGKTADLAIEYGADDTEGVVISWSDGNGELDSHGATLTTPPVNGWSYYECTIMDRFGNHDNVWFYVDNRNFTVRAEGEEVGETYAIVDCREGEPVDLKAIIENVTEGEEITCQWFKSDKWQYEWDRIVGATDSTYTVRLVIPGTSYKCRVQDSHGNTAEIRFTLRTNHLKAEPAGGEDASVITAAPGQKVMLRVIVTADDMSRLDYEWSDDNDVSHELFTDDPTACRITAPAYEGEFRYFFNVYDQFGNNEFVRFMILVDEDYVPLIDLSDEDNETKVEVADTGLVYDGKAKTPAVTVTCAGRTLDPETDYTVEYKDNTNAGTATVTVTGKGSYTESASAEFTIARASIKDALVTGISDKVYTGKAVTQTPVVKLGGKTIKADTDYTVSCKNNTNAGTATVTITGKGNYTGTAVKTFAIARAAQTITARAAAAKISVGKKTKITASGAKETKKYTYTSSNTAVATVAADGTVTGKKAGTAVITVSTPQTANYKKGSKTVKITVQLVLKKPGNCHFVKWNNAKYNSCRIAWNKVAGATGYQSVLSWTDGSHASTKILKSNVLSQNCSVTVNHVSQFKVRAFADTAGGRVYSPWSNLEYITPSPTKLTYKNVSSGANLKAKLSWNIIYGCNGYNVFLTTNPNGTWYWNQSTNVLATSLNATITKYRGSKLKKNTRYYVRIVTRRKRNGVFCTVPMPANNTNIGSFVIK